MQYTILWRMHHPEVIWLAFNCDQDFDFSPVMNADIKAHQKASGIQIAVVESKIGVTL